MNKKILSFISAILISSSVSAINYETLFYKNLVKNEISLYQSNIFSEIMNIDTFLHKNNFSNMSNVVDYCFNQNEKELLDCYTILSRIGYSESFNGLGEYHFNKYLSATELEEKNKHLIFSAKFYGLESGFSDLVLKYQQPRSKRQNFGEFLKNPNLNVRDLNPLKEYYFIGLMYSIDYDLNNLHYEYKGNYEIEKFIDLEDIKEDEDKLAIENNNFDFLYDKYRTISKNPTAINFIIRTALDKRKNDFFKALMYGENQIERNEKIGNYGLLFNALNNKDKESLVILSIDRYRKYKLNPNLQREERAKLLREAILFSALLKELDKNNQNNIIYTILSDNKENEGFFINTVREFNNFRKEAILFLEK